MLNFSHGDLFRFVQFSGCLLDGVKILAEEILHLIHNDVNFSIWRPLLSESVC